jgi:hypothetical protein
VVRLATTSTTAVTGRPFRPPSAMPNHTTDERFTSTSHYSDCHELRQPPQLQVARVRGATTHAAKSTAIAISATRKFHGLQTRTSVRPPLMLALLTGYD